MKHSPLKTLRSFVQRHPLAARRALRGAWFAAAASLIQMPHAAHAQTAYTWTSPTAGGAWTTGGNWTPTGVPGTNAGDTATLTNATANRDITLNTSETIAGLTFTETSGVTNELEIDQNGTGAITLTNTNTTALALGGSGVTGTELLYLNGTGSAGVAAYSGAINIGTNGVLELSSYSNSGYSKITGAVSLASGGLLNADQVISTSSGTPTITGNLTVASGANVKINTTNTGGVASTGVDTRLNITGNLVVSGGTIANNSTTLITNGTPTNASPSAELYLSGASAEFDTGTTLTNLGTTSTGGIFYTGTATGSLAAPNFKLTSDVSLPVVSLAPGNASGTSYISVGAVTGSTFTATALLYTVAAGATEEITLNNNTVLTGKDGASANLNVFAAVNSKAGTIILNLNGNTLDTTQSTAGVRPGGAFTYSILGNGTFGAAFFNLSTTGTGSNGVNIGSGVILNATGGTATANILTNTSGTGSTIDPASTFYYTGAGTSASPATLTSTRNIGILTVGNGTAASNLQLVTAGLTAAGTTTVASGSTLQLNGQTLTLSSTSNTAAAPTGNLAGFGTVAGTSSGAAVTGSAVAFTGNAGIAPGSNTTVGMLTLAGTQAVNLGTGSLSIFKIASTSIFDQLLLSGSAVSLNYNNSALYLNFLNGYAPTSGSYQIVSGTNAATTTNNFTTITSNLNNGDSFSFNPATGLLTITAVPEPATMVQTGIVLAFIFGASAFKRMKGSRAMA